MKTMSSSEASSLFSVMVVSGGATLILATALALAMMRSNNKSTLLSYVSSKQDASSNDSTALNGNSGQEASSSELDTTKFPGGAVTVYYGTQTGTAESFAQQIEREGQVYGFLVHVVDMEDVAQVQDLAKSEIALFFVATYGEGEPPDNARELYEQMQTRIADRGDSSLSFDFGVFGLGNREYDQFNAMGKQFDQMLETLGGTRVVELGLGDDNEDLEGDFENWKDNVLWPALKRRYLKTNHVIEKVEHLPESPWKVIYHDDTTVQSEPDLKDVHASSRHYFTSVDCPVLVNRELRNVKEDSEGSTVHLELDLSKAGITYHTADNAGVLPLNTPGVVETVAKALKVDLDKLFSVEAAPHHEWHGIPFPMPLSIRECLTRYCDLTSAPRRSELKVWATYAKDTLDKEFLLRLASKQGKAEYKEKILDAHVGLVNLLQQCPSLQPSWEAFVAFCPRLLPRYYTISSSSTVHPTTMHLTVSVINKNNRNHHYGVCSKYLAQLKPNRDSVRLFVRPSSFRLPKDISRPVVMIGPGTGLAPMRAFLQERHAQAKNNNESGTNILYFGCKKPTLDYLYRDELQYYVENKTLHHLRLAFSREQENKIYVQHVLAQHGKETRDLIYKQQAHVYICGGVKMGHDVVETLQEICMENDQMSRQQAKEYLAQMTKEGRLVQELWA